MIVPGRRVSADAASAVSVVAAAAYIVIPPPLTPPLFIGTLPWQLQTPVRGSKC